MEKLTMKERVAFNLIFNEKRVYRHWYSRFQIAGVELDRIRRVVSRIPKWHVWCHEWRKEGLALERLARESLDKGNLHTARRMFHQAAGCHHVGQHFFYIDPELKDETQERVRINYQRALSLDDGEQKPLRIDIPFENTQIPGYLWKAKKANSPLILLISGMDNLKETENHLWGQVFSECGFNLLTFDGPGQGEMWKDMKYIPDYERAATAILNWFEANNSYGLDLSRIGVLGFSLGGYLAPRTAAFDSRISCAVGNGGPADMRGFTSRIKVNPLLIKGFQHLTGAKTYRQAVDHLSLDIRTAPPLDRPLLVFHTGADKLIPNGKDHADVFMQWAVGEKELKFYPDGEHVCANYLDEVIPYTIDWLKKHLV